jgi:iron complex outermembrane recepter protein
MKNLNLISRGLFASAFIVLSHLQVANAQLEDLTEEEIEQIPSISVTADPFNTSLFEYGKPVSVMDEDDIESKMQSTLGETISLEPGVSSSFFGQGASRPIIRGFGGDRVRVLKNGVTTGDVSDISEDHVVVADPMQSQQIEILRGPETLLYGNGAIGGAVNVTDDSIPEKALGKPFEGKFLGQLGDSADNEKTLGAKFLWETGKLNWHASGFVRETDDYEIPGYAESSNLREMEEHEDNHEEDHGDDHVDNGDHDEEGESYGKVDNTDTQTWGTTGGVSSISDKGFLGLSVSGFGSDYGIPGHVHVDEEEHGHDHEDEVDDHDDGDEEHLDEHGGGEDDVRIEAQQFRVDTRGRIDEVNDDIESVKFRLGYADYKHDEIEGGDVATTYERDMVESRVEFLHAPINQLRGALGLQVLYDDFSAEGEETFLVPVQTFSPALFAFEELGVTETLDLKFGARVEAVNHDPEGIKSEDFVPFSLSAGPLWDPTGKEEYNVGLTFAYSQRAPNAVELFSDGQHLARQIYEVGDSGLDKEASLGADLVFKKNKGMFTGAFTPFYQGFSNYINLSGTGEEVEGLPVYTYEEIEAYFWGFEFESAFHLDELIEMGPHAVALEYQLDYVRARNEDDSGDLPRIPPFRNIARVRYSFQDVFSAFVEGVFVQDQDEVAEYELPTEGYNLLNVEAEYKLPYLQNKDLKLFVRGTNLTDDEARVHSSFLKDLAPLRGRALLFGFKVNI